MSCTRPSSEAKSGQRASLKAYGNKPARRKRKAAIRANRALQSHPQKSAQWQRLPPEIRLMIMGYAIEDKPLYWEHWASINHEWQHFIESLTFRHLRLNQDDLETFAQVSTRTREHIRHVQLVVDLKTYTCRSCASLESKTWQKANNRRVASAVWTLFSILGKWTLSHSLTFELHAYSRSDAAHWFREMVSESNEREDHDDIREALFAELRSYDPSASDLRHGWAFGERFADPPEKAILRTSQTIGIARFRKPLPVVKAVTRFMIRQQTRRMFSPSTLQLILEKLPSLNDFHYEAQFPFHARRLAQAEMAAMIDEQVAQGVTRINIVETLDNYVQQMLMDGQLTNILWSAALRTDDGIPHDVLDDALIRRSQNLEFLSSTGFVEAGEFFENAEAKFPDMHWPRLEELALSIYSFTDTLEPDDTFLRETLILAAKTVRRMPKLRTLVIWCSNGDGWGVVVITIERRCLRLEMRGNMLDEFRVQFHQDVLDAWNATAKHKNLPPVVHERELTDDWAEDAEGIAEARLPIEVMHPASLKQLQIQEYLRSDFECSYVRRQR